MILSVSRVSRVSSKLTAAILLMFAQVAAAQSQEGGSEGWSLPGPGTEATDDGAFRLDASLGALSPVAPAEAFQSSWQDVKPAGKNRRLGYYVRVSGMVVEQQNDGRPSSGEPIEFNTGGGFSLAIGYRLGDEVPISLEGEYTYRYVDADGAIGGDGSIKLHTLAFNVVLDLPDLLGPVGLYGGGGIGFTIDSFAFSSSGSGSSAAISGNGFYWQFRGGLTISITSRMQLYAGVIWSDAGTSSNAMQTVDIEMLSAEFGFRMFF